VIWKHALKNASMPIFTLFASNRSAKSKYTLLG
jgi:ABC-type dipeptide/oligopeptide/nickel transport system permease component